MLNRYVISEFETHRWMTIQERDPTYPRVSHPVKFVIEGEYLFVQLAPASEEALWMAANHRVRIKPCDEHGTSTGEDAAAIALVASHHRASLFAAFEEKYGSAQDEPDSFIEFSIEPLIFDREKLYDEYLDHKMGGNR